MSDSTRWRPTEAEIERLLIDTSTHRDALALVLRNQKVSLPRARQREGDRYRYKNVLRNVHFVYFDNDTQKWTGQIHRDPNRMAICRV